MNFLQARINEIIERSGLRLAVLSLSLVSLTFGGLYAMDLSREPVVVERSCETSLLHAGSSTQTPEEIEAFLKEAVAERFDSTPAKDPADYLVQDIAVVRDKEQSELKRNSVDQRMIVRSVKPEGNRFLIEADRIVAAGKARSAIPVELLARISSKTRNTTNPYGLILVQIEQRKDAHD